MKEPNWSQLRVFVEHSGLSEDDVMDACNEFMARRTNLRELREVTLETQMDMFQSGRRVGINDAAIDQFIEEIREAVCVESP